MLNVTVEMTPQDVTAIANTVRTAATPFSPDTMAEGSIMAVITARVAANILPTVQAVGELTQFGGHVLDTACKRLETKRANGECSGPMWDVWYLALTDAFCWVAGERYC